MADRTRISADETLGTASTNLAVEVEKVEGKEVDLDLDILGLDVLSLPATEVLERQEPLVVRLPGDGLAVDNERLDSLLDALSEERQQRAREEKAKDARAAAARRGLGT